jgi:hypothetical protein
MQRFVAYLILALGLAATASATIVIVDDFSTSQGPISASGGGTTTSTFLTIGQPLGLDRQLFIDYSAGSLFVDNRVASGFFLFGVGPFSDGDGGARYRKTGGGPVGLPTSLSSFLLDVIVADITGGAIQMFATDGVTTWTSSPSLLLPLAPPGYTLTFTAASFGGGFTPAAVTEFGFRLFGVDSLDVVFNNFRLEFPDRPPSEIPEPATFAMMGAGLVGLAFFRRRK